MPQALDGITFHALNGEKVTAPLWIWMTALVEALDDDKKKAMLTRIAQIVNEAKEKKIVQPRHYVMQAECGIYNSLK